MSRLRTDEEKIAILEHCLELERTGGDILGYLWSQDYLTPRATWFNYQREWLGRKPYEFTDGKPRVIRGERKMNNKNDKRKVLEAVITAIERGDDPLVFMTTFGYQAPQAAYAALKKYAKANAPELAPKLPDLRAMKEGHEEGAGEGHAGRSGFRHDGRRGGVLRQVRRDGPEGERRAGQEAGSAGNACRSGNYGGKPPGSWRVLP